ncbi:hypothetical protein [Microseira sp. BLCC-F43]|jgi:hypothetical protein|uniref:hypothetical protein n=1 Tax=Microseira sp. BLCC-F43 TaxID=3153602 RepID=UPI0035B87B2E
MTNGVLQAGTVLGCNSPKPGKASKPGSTTNGESSFYLFSNRATLLAANWNLTFPNYSAQRVSSPRSKLVKVNMRAGSIIISYGWRMDMEQYNVIGNDRTALGIEDVVTSDLPTTCFGVNKPKPNRVRKYVTVGTGENAQGGVTTTFVDTARESSLPEGWIMVGQRGGRIGFTPTSGQAAP